MTELSERIRTGACCEADIILGSNAHVPVQIPNRSESSVPQQRIRASDSSPLEVDVASGGDADVALIIPGISQTELQSISSMPDLDVGRRSSQSLQ